LTLCAANGRRADLVLIEEMRRYGQVSSLDEQPIPELNSEAIDFRAASEFFRPIRKLARREMETLKLATIVLRSKIPNYCLSASPSTTFKKASQSSATGSSCAYFKTSD